MSLGIVGLERIPTKKLKRGMLCPICGGDFLDGMFSSRENIHKLIIMNVCFVGGEFR